MDGVSRKLTIVWLFSIVILDGGKQGFVELAVKIATNMYSYFTQSL